MAFPPVGNLSVAQFDRLIVEKYPYIPWLEPILFTVASVPNRTGLACRLCIARNGLGSAEFLPMTELEHADHMAAEHPEILAQCRG